MDDLKAKLAAQEVELKLKNDDADALIKRVGVEQEKVGIKYWFDTSWQLVPIQG